MLTAVLVACVAAALGVLLVAARRRRAGSEARFEVILEQLDRHMGAISESLERVVDRSSAARARGVDELELTVDFGELLRRIATEAASRTSADAAAIHIQGPGGIAMMGSFGADDRAQGLEAPLTHAAGPFRAVTINWTYRPGFEGGSEPLASALVVPIVEAGVETGTLAAYAPDAGAFGAEHVRALEALAEEVVPAITSARRFAEAQTALTDAATGLRNRQGYVVELDRAITHAQETGQPLSLLILYRDDTAEPEDHPREPPELALRELASLLRRHTRNSDVVCLRQDGEFGIVLPETAGDAARRFYVRLRDEAARTTFPLSRQLTFAAGVVEWRPDETSDALDARATAAARTSRVGVLELAARPARATSTSVATTRHEFEDRLRQEIARARSLDRPLSLLLMNVDGLAYVGERRDPEAAERALAELESRVGSKLENGDVSCHIGEEEFAVILGSATADRAEALLGGLRSSLEKDPPIEFEWLGVSAGITELAWGDDAASVFGRVEHALWRAKRAGTGTVVVAMAADDSRRST
jgi:diguanylate cyclase (GGDEF)-like protein